MTARFSPVPMAALFRALLAVAGLAASAAALSQAQSSPDPTRIIDSLEAWDSEIGKLTQIAWNVSAKSATSGKDYAGRTFQEHWDENVFTPKAKAALDELRATAGGQSAAGDTEGLKRTLAQANSLVHAEIYKSLVVLFYWQMQGGMAQHLKLIQPWLDRATPAERKTVTDRAGASYDLMTDKYAEALKSTVYTIDRVGDLVISSSRSFGYFDTERERLVIEQASLPSPIAIEPLKRTSECPAPVAPLAGKDKPSLAADFPSSETFYPPESKMMGVMGNVTVKVSVSGTGCVEDAEVVTSSGAKDLDQAALALAMAGRYVPAAAGDQGVPGSLKFRIRFEPFTPRH